jgi:hypothetical protein
MTPTVTVIVPTRNRPALLREALASIADQEVPSGMVETIVVNDGGVDVTTAVDYAATRGLRVRALTLPHHAGLSAARNLGIQEARGDFLAFLDDDDIFLPSHLRTALTALEVNKSPAVYTSCLVRTSRLRPGSAQGTGAAHCYDFPFCPGLLSVSNYIPVHSLVLRSCAARFDPALSALEDWDMWLRLVHDHGFSFEHIPEATVVYHRIPGETSMTGCAATQAATLARFASQQRHIWARWPPDSGRAARFRLYLAVMYWQALARHATGQRVSTFYYYRTMRAIFSAWTWAEPEGELIDRIATAVGDDSEAANVA